MEKLIMLDKALNDERLKGYSMDEDFNFYSHKVKKSNGKTFWIEINKEPIKKMTIGKSRDGYPKIKFSFGNMSVHRIIARIFIPNPENKEQVNHIDGDKENYQINNLEWVTNRENREHAIENGLLDNIGYGISQYDLNGKFLREFDTCLDALEFLGIDQRTSGNIGRCIRGKRKTAYGYIWKQTEKGSTTIENT